MAAMDTLRDILNDTPVDATDVEWNFNTIQAYIASDLIKRDGTTAMTAALSLVAGDPVSDAHAANKGYVDAILPTGMLMDYLGETLSLAMDGKWLICDGTVVSRTTYADLFALIGTTFNTGGEGGTQFRLPDFRKRVSVGFDSATAPFDALGYGGWADPVFLAHTHTGPSHTHSFSATSGSGGSHTHTYSDTTSSDNHSHTYTLASASGGQYVVGAGGAALNQTSSSSTGSDSHTHTVSGTTDSGGSHTHSVSGTTGASGTDATGSTGEVSVTNRNYPPFVVVTKVVKV